MTNPETPGRAAQEEREYYLPPKGSGLAQEWERDSSQELYTDLCCRGHNMIANAIIEGKKTGHPPSVKDLYKIAARVRRAMAILNPAHGNNYLLYGRPHMDIELAYGAFVNDLIGSAGVEKRRYGTFFDAVHKAFEDRFLKGIDFGWAFGHEYSRSIEKNRAETSVTISRKGCRVAKIVFKPPTPASLASGSGDKGTIYLQHALVRDQDKLFAEADKHFQAILAQDPPDAEKFWREMGAISLELFHAPPLRLGSQTATLMVLAGITKAMGFDIVPRRLETDHFIEAELTPYKQYIKEYGSKFIHPPVQFMPRDKSIPVDESFIQDAYAKLRDHYKALDPVKKLETFLNEEGIRNGRSGRSLIPLNSMKVENGKIAINILWGTDKKSYEQQTFIERALEFIGHQDLIDMLGLPPQAEYTIDSKWDEALASMKAHEAKHGVGSYTGRELIRKDLPKSFLA